MSANDLRLSPKSLTANSTTVEDRVEVRNLTPVYEETVTPTTEDKQFDEDSGKPDKTDEGAWNRVSDVRRNSKTYDTTRNVCLC